MKYGEVDQEDNKVLDLVLKGVYTVMLKSQSMEIDHDVKKMIEAQINILFKLTHHKVFKIQLKTLMLLFQFAKASQKLTGGFDVKIDDVKEGSDDEG